MLGLVVRESYNDMVNTNPAMSKLLQLGGERERENLLEA